MTLDSKALSAARKAVRGEGLGVRACEERLIKAYLDAADLVGRSELDEFRASAEHQAAILDRDIARREAEEQGRYVAALREALQWALAYAGPELEALAVLPNKSRKRLAQARAALTDTAEAAARYRLVDDEHVVVPVEPTMGMLEELYSPWLSTVANETRIKAYKAMIAAAPKAGEGTEPE